MERDTQSISQDNARHCMICLGCPSTSTPPGKAVALSTADLSAESSPFLQCPIDGRIICHSKCLEDLVLFNVAPERLRAYHGLVPCPWIDASALRESPCSHRWQYRDLVKHLSFEMQIKYTEEMTAFIRTLLGNPSESARETDTLVNENKEKKALTMEDPDDPRVLSAAAHIKENILNLRCPQCMAVFYDFDACCAVTCRACGISFCGLCMMPPGGKSKKDGNMEGSDRTKEAAHAHVIAVHGRLFMQEEEILRQQNVFRQHRLVHYLVSLAVSPSSLPPSLPSLLFPLLLRCPPTPPCPRMTPGSQLRAWTSAQREAKAKQQARRYGGLLRSHSSGYRSQP